MTTQASTDLEGFARFLQQKLDVDATAFSPDQVLAQWRERAETIDAVRDGIRAVDVGRTKPIDQFAEDFRARHDIREDA
jgi:hypothetical protein